MKASVVWRMVVVRGEDISGVGWLVERLLGCGWVPCCKRWFFLEARERRTVAGDLDKIDMVEELATWHRCRLSLRRHAVKSDF